MGQQEIYKALKGKKTFIATDNICKMTNSNYNQVIRALATMLRYGEVIRRRETQHIITDGNSYVKKISLWRLNETY